jgi:hypothetical protein
VTTPSAKPARMIGLRPILSDSQPKRIKKGVPSARAIAERCGRLNPRRIEAALVAGSVFAYIDRRPAIFTAECESLREAQANQNDRRDDAGSGVGRQQSDEERANAHERHCDDERILAADDVAEPSEKERAKRANGEAGGERKQREDESRRRIDPGKELRRENRRQRSVDIKIVPLENGAERRGENDHPFLGGHCAFAVLTRSHCCHGRCPCLSIVGFLVGNGFSEMRPKGCPAAEIRRESIGVCPPEVLGQRAQTPLVSNWMKRKIASGAQRICRAHSNASHRKVVRSSSRVISQEAA